ncbi:MAG: c-type cytochrome [Gaiellales bacterium]|jgi:cytochrome c551
MLKVLVAALVGTVVGVAVMVTVIAIAGTDTEGATSVGLSSLPLSTQTPGSTAAPSSGPSSTPSSSGSSGDVAAGKTVFDDNCASCHSAVAGTPSPLPAAPNLAELAPTLDTETILTQIKNGGGPMPAGLVSGADADNVAAYILSLGQ